jgi:hypothetical protein
MMIPRSLEMGDRRSLANKHPSGFSYSVTPTLSDTFFGGNGFILLTG